MLMVDYVEGDPEDYILPIAFSTGPEAERSALARQDWLWPPLRTRKGFEGIFYDAAGQPEFGSALLSGIQQKAIFTGQEGEMHSEDGAAFTGIVGNSEELPKATIGKAEQSNSSILFGDLFFLKLFRRLEPGTNPDLEIGRFLTAKGFTHVPPVAGWLDIRRPQRRAFQPGNAYGAGLERQRCMAVYAGYAGPLFRTGAHERNEVSPLENSPLVHLAGREVPDEFRI